MKEGVVVSPLYLSWVNALEVVLVLLVLEVMAGGNDLRARNDLLQENDGRYVETGLSSSPDL